MRIVIDKKRFCLVLGTVTLLIILFIVCVSNLKGNKNEDKNIENSLTNKVELQKNEITKQDFLEEYTKISNKISEKLLDGTVYDNETLSLAIAKYNKILSSTNWSDFRTFASRKICWCVVFK